MSEVIQVERGMLPTDAWSPAAGTIWRKLLNLWY